MSDEYVLRMPARRFFVYLEKIHRMQIREKYAWLRDLTDVAAVAICGKDYHDSLKRQFETAMIDNSDRTNAGTGRAIPADSKLASKGIAAMLSAKGKVRVRNG